MYKTKIFKRPKTTQERRENGRRSDHYDNHEFEFKFKIRSKRNQKNLTEAWDDNLRSDLCLRTWKRNRKTQYKIKEVK